MNIELADEALEYGTQVRRALEAAGGDELVRKAEAQPAERETIARVLGELGAWELSPRQDAVELEAAAALCRSAGYWAAPYPVAERLARPADLDVDGLVVVADATPMAAVAGIELRWAAVDFDGRRSLVTAAQPDVPPRNSAFVTPLRCTPVDTGGAGDIALALVLPCWTLLGMLDRAIDLARDHVVVRQQFGQALARFQSVQFQLTDAEVERAGVEMLARYALWSIQAGNEQALDDALALRLAAIEAADVVLRVSHQLHGALGFCDEATLSWLSRYSWPVRRLPLGRSATEDLLTRRIARHGLPGLFSEPRGV
ncbi:acyl-CoA dehydrogenase family protein [Nocardia sp. alder85J]|uniref:acyl-CoA dehydrogenase family protein n=1 Tax=Nocardia sp. alder85J TaxID=2862949 RepID=UPI001CD51428|nr:acyl-CoA dehydrogenase family protein [Nocardia sp. alder85J]MCX4096891.1 acyl-CoA dehydrogenase family protein [Nocardia sp. alder85J]